MVFRFQVLTKGDLTLVDLVSFLFNSARFSKLVFWNGFVQYKILPCENKIGLKIKSAKEIFFKSESRGGGGGTQWKKIK